MRIAGVIFGAAAVLLLAWMFRYQVTMNADGSFRARYDRLTGAVEFFLPVCRDGSGLTFRWGQYADREPAWCAGSVVLPDAPFTRPNAAPK